MKFWCYNSTYAHLNQVVEHSCIGKRLGRLRASGSYNHCFLRGFLDELNESPDGVRVTALSLEIFKNQSI